MQTVNFLYQSMKQLEALIETYGLNQDTPYFIKIHTASHTRKESVRIAKKLKEIFPNAKILGTSTCAVLYNGEQYDSECLISISKFERSTVKIQVFSYQNVSPRKLAERIISAMVTEHTKLMYTFFSDLYEETFSYVKAFNQLAGHIALIGGIVADAVSIDESNYIFTEKGSFEQSVLIASISGKHLNSYSTAVIGHDPISDLFTLTKVNGGVWETVDHQPAKEWFQEQIGLSDLEENTEWKYSVESDIIVKFPIILEGHQGASRFLRYDSEIDKMTQYFSKLPEGIKFRIGYLNSLRSADKWKEICEQVQSVPVEDIFSYSCSFRKMYLNNCSKWEMTPFAKIGIYGAFMYGEIGNIHGVNEFLNGTCCLAALAEKNHYVSLDMSVFENVYQVQDDSKDLLNYVLKKQSETVISKNQALMERLLEQEALTERKMFVDEYTGLDNHARYIQNLQFENYDKLCLIIIEKEDILFNHLGKQGYMMLLQENVAQIQAFLKATYPDVPYDLYSRDNKSFIIAANPSCSTKKFKQMIKSLFANCGTLSLLGGTVTCIHNFILVLEQESPLKKAEFTLASQDKVHTRFCIYKSEGIEEARLEQELKMVAIINDAILAERIIPYFQGIYDNKTGKIDKFEALMRIQDSEGKIYTPDQFLPIAKKYHLYMQLTKQMFEKVFFLFDKRKEKVAINLSPNDVMSPEIHNFLLDFLRQSRDSSRFIFEILESEEIHDFEQFNQMLEGFRKYGAQIAIDDFGSGYSNLIEIAKLNPEYIKIDGEIIKYTTGDSIYDSIVSTITFLANELNIDLVAEFVANEEIQKRMEEKNISYSQGYYFCKPIPYHELEEQYGV